MNLATNLSPHCSHAVVKSSPVVSRLFHPRRTCESLSEQWHSGQLSTSSIVQPGKDERKDARWKADIEGSSTGRTANAAVEEVAEAAAPLADGVPKPAEAVMSASESALDSEENSSPDSAEAVWSSSLLFARAEPAPAAAPPPAAPRMGEE